MILLSIPCLHLITHCFAGYWDWDEKRVYWGAAGGMVGSTPPGATTRQGVELPYIGLVRPQALREEVALEEALEICGPMLQKMQRLEDAYPNKEAYSCCLTDEDAAALEGLLKPEFLAML